MSDPTFSDVDFKNKMALVWTTLKNESFEISRNSTYLKAIGFSIQTQTNIKCCPSVPSVLIALNWTKNYGFVNCILKIENDFVNRVAWHRDRFGKILTTDTNQWH